MILTFSYEGMKEAVLDGSKTVTRRTWTTSYMERFYNRHSTGNWWSDIPLAIAYDKSPRAGGKPFAKLRILGLLRDDVSTITPYQVQREGFPDGDVEKFIALWDKTHKTRECYRVEFELVEVLE